ncbi:MAG TPA: Imm63 family immunity protein [Allosphingosinicella sp.]|jgi:hypothetical protein
MVSEAKLTGAACIQKRAHELASQLGKLDFQLPSKPSGDGSHHLEVRDAYYLVVTDRDHEVERRRTTDPEELLYWLMEALTSSLSWTFERGRRRESEDPRRQAFEKQLKLLGTLSPDWARRRSQEQTDILSRHPFSDY